MRDFAEPSPEINPSLSEPAPDMPPDISRADTNPYAVQQGTTEYAAAAQESPEGVFDFEGVDNAAPKLAAETGGVVEPTEEPSQESQPEIRELPPSWGTSVRTFMETLAPQKTYESEASPYAETGLLAAEVRKGQLWHKDTEHEGTTLTVMPEWQSNGRPSITYGELASLATVKLRVSSGDLAQKAVLYHVGVSVEGSDEAFTVEKLYEEIDNEGELADATGRRRVTSSEELKSLAVLISKARELPPSTIPTLP